MLLVLSLVSQVIVSLANPLGHPFQYLIDVGDEQIDQAITQNIGVSLQGSIAIRYPDTGDGDTIAHIAATAVDFGADVKGNIVDGGPGFKYVVLAFQGIPGKYYEVHVTLQTLPSSQKSVYISQDKDNDAIARKNYDPYGVERDNNDSSEEDDFSTKYSTNMNAELTQSSSNVYSYAVNEMSQASTNNDDNGDDNDNDPYDYVDQGNDAFKDEAQNEISPDFDSDHVAGEEKEIHSPTPGKTSYNNVEEEDYDNTDIQASDTQVETASRGDESYQKPIVVDTQVETASRGDESYQKPIVVDTQVETASRGDESYQKPIVVDSYLYKMYKALQSHLPMDRPVEQLNIGEDNDKSYRENPEEIDQMFNDEEVHNDGRYWDSYNNNNFDTDDSSAVAY